MCGIIGRLGRQDVIHSVVQGLAVLEYRGYDSAGVAVVSDEQLDVYRAAGRLDELRRILPGDSSTGLAAIGHTRWATHGAPTASNAHPHRSQDVAVVHNGIIENHQRLRIELMDRGVHFESETDSEVIPYLIQVEIDDGASPVEAVRAAVARLEGAFAFVAIFAGHDDMLIAARRGSPLVFGEGPQGVIIASDVLAVAGNAESATNLLDGDILVATHFRCVVTDKDGNEVERQATPVSWSESEVQLGSFDHFTLKEIYEQVGVARRLMSEELGKHLLEACDLCARASHLVVAACGSSRYAAQVARPALEELGLLRVEVEIASEFLHRPSVCQPSDVGLVISQSGETADTLAALRRMKSLGMKVIAAVNQTQSTIAREADAVLPLCAGPEIGVASTKAFTAQVLTLLRFAIGLGLERGGLFQAEARALFEQGSSLSEALTTVLRQAGEFEELGRSLADAKRVIYLGRGAFAALAAEGALKLKEISYIHAEGFPAGEMKHGPIALLEEGIPVIACVPSGPLFDKTVSGLREAAARGARVIAFTDAAGAQVLAPEPFETITVIEESTFWSSPVYAIPLQLIAYHAARAVGADVDRPRNLAKSVTVE